MDTRRKVELQIRAVTVTYRRERRRLDPDGLRMMRERGRALLDEIESETLPFPELLAALRNVREELERDGRLAAGMLSPQPIDDEGEPLDTERLR